MPKKSIILITLLMPFLLIILFRNQIVLTIDAWQHRVSKNMPKRPLPELPAELKKALLEYLQTHFQNPEEYIINKFKDHDIVFLGEFHRIRHDPELVQHIVPLLYRHGIYNLGMEFACRRDQALIDSLVTAPDYDQSVTNRILADFIATWGYQDYADIFKAVWQLNRSLPDSVRKFRLVGLNAFNNWSLVKTEADRRDPKILAKVHAEGYGDSVMAETVLREIVAKKEKALIYCGLHHAFTQYHQPMYDAQKDSIVDFFQDRLGLRVFKAIGRRAFTISLHAPWNDPKYEKFVYPLNGAIDALMKEIGDRFYPVGFDTRNTPFGELTDTASIYQVGYPDFKLADFCDGYIFQKPISQYRTVTPIPGFINKHNVDWIRAHLSNPRLKNTIWWKILSPETMGHLQCSHVSIEKWFSDFQ